MKASDLEEVRIYLTGADLETSAKRLGEANGAWRRLKKIKEAAVSGADEDTAKLAWCYEQILNIQTNYLQAFGRLKSGKFYEAWCLFERVEIGLHHLERHFPIADDTFKLLSIAKYTRQFQSLYPYKYFLSPAYLILEAFCSICGRKRSVRSPCEHVVGDIYNGEMCCREVKKAKLLEVSIVEKPAQKYSVPFTRDPETREQVDHYNYSLVEYVTNGLREPFDEWDSRWTEVRHPHSRYKHVGRNEECPCESSKKYKKCCLNEGGVLRPHLEITFSVPPPQELPPIMYV